VKQSEGTWREQYANALADLGFRRLAENVRECGQVVASRACLDCHEPHAHNTLKVSCSARGCSHCARYQSHERQKRLLPALERVPEFFAARRIELHREAHARWSDAREKVRHYAQLASERTGRSRERALKLYETWDTRRRQFGFQVARLDPAPVGKRGKPLKVEQWGWRLLTISPAWNPANSEELTVRGLRRRYESVVERWREIQRALGPAVSAVVSVEFSSGGFVHLHALVFCSEFVAKEFLAKKAGCFVDIRSLKPSYKKGRSAQDTVRAALKEGVKYAIKNASPLSGEWIGGKRRKLVHPEAAARWTIAVHKRQLGRVYGEVLRDALKLTDREATVSPTTEPLRRCFCCGSIRLDEPLFLPTRQVARELGPLWGRSAHWERSIPTAKAPAETGAEGS
jgi:hypothetical protein